MQAAGLQQPRAPTALYALTAGAFGIGTTEFVIMGLLLQVAGNLHVSFAAAGLLVSGYALRVFVGAPFLDRGTGDVGRLGHCAVQYAPQLNLETE